MKSRPLILYSILYCLSLSADPTITLSRAITLALKHHPAIEADKSREVAREKRITASESRYYPKVSALAIVTNGFPGSTSALGIGGLVGSSYRKGPSAGLLLEQDIFDFGRTSTEVDIAKKESLLSKVESGVTAAGLGTEVVHLYYECALHKSLYEFYDHLLSDTRLVEKEVEKFVKNGQRSLVEQLLSQSQTEEAGTSAVSYEKEVRYEEKQLSALVYDNDEVVACPSLSAALTSRPTIPSVLDSSKSPYLLKAQAEASLSQAQISRARRDYYPRLVGLASAGYLDGTQAGATKQNYSVGVGLIVPLFEGFKTNADVDSALATNLQKEKEVEASSLNLKEKNLSYDRDIETAKLRVTNLSDEVALADQAFQLAKRRYLSHEGTLVDLRESIRNLERSHTQLGRAQTEFLEKTAEKVLVNGGIDLLAKE